MHRSTAARALNAATSHLISCEVVQRVQAEARRLGADLVTTEKDWVRLPPQWRGRVKAWPVRARFEDAAAMARMLAQASPQAAPAF